MNSLVDVLNRVAGDYWSYLMHAGWQAAVVGLLLLALVRWGAKWRAPWRHALLLIALFKFAVPPFLSVGSGVMSWVSVVRFEEGIRDLGWGGGKGTQGTQETQGTQGTKGRGLDVGVGGEGARRVEPAHGAVRLTEQTVAVRGSVPLEWRAWGFVAHVGGTLVILIWVMRQVWVLRSWVRASRRVENGPVLGIVEELSRKLELRRVPDLRLSKHVVSPVAFGVWRPTILLPADSLARLSESELRGVLGHELAHFRRGDLWLNWFQVLLLAAWWIHPVLWLVNRALRRVREDCCDDLVLAHRVSSRERYGEVLVRAASVFANPGTLTGTLGFGGELHPLGRRLVRIMDPSIVRVPRLSLGGMLVAVAAALVLLPGVRLESVGRAQLAKVVSTPPITETEMAPYQSGRPKLIAVAPGPGSTDVAPDTRIRLRFDRPMDSNRMELHWQTGGIYGRGEPEYLEATHEFVLPVRLVPGARHALRINGGFGAREDDGFQSRDGVVAEPATIEFTTAWTAVRGPEPKVVSLFPPSGAEVGRVTMVRIEFDQAMDPDRYTGVFTPETGAGSALPWSKVKPLALVEWEAEGRVAHVPVILPADWKGSFKLHGFCSALGATSPPVTITYSSTKEIWSAADAERRRATVGSAKVREIVASTQATRRALKSLSETVREVGWSAAGLEGRCGVQLRVSTFKMQGERQFFGDVRHIIGIPFSVGSDGKDCWFQALRKLDDQSEARLVVQKCAFEDIPEKDLAFADPFPSAEGIEYLGMSDLQGRPCHRLRAWDAYLNEVRVGTDDIWLTARTWWIDAKESRLILREDHNEHGGRSETWFIWDRVNEHLADHEFQPSAGPAALIRPLDPLGDGYTVRTLHVRDGSDGRMSLRWGMRGPKGSISSGLN